MQLKIRRDQTLSEPWLVSAGAQFVELKKEENYDQNKSRCGQCKSCVVRDTSRGKMAETGATSGTTE